MNLIVYGVIALAIMGALGGAYHTVKESGRAECRLKTEEANAERMKEEVGKAFLASTKLEDGNAKSKIVYRTITRDVDKVVNRVEYRDVCLDPDGLRLANDALRGARAPVGGPDGGLPGPGAAGRGISSGSAPKAR